jgi:hypothetical protein
VCVCVSVKKKFLNTGIKRAWDHCWGLPARKVFKGTQWSLWHIIHSADDDDDDSTCYFLTPEPLFIEVVVNSSWNPDFVVPWTGIHKHKVAFWSVCYGHWQPNIMCNMELIDIAPRQDISLFQSCHVCVHHTNRYHVCFWSSFNIQWVCFVVHLNQI